MADQDGVSLDKKRLKKTWLVFHHGWLLNMARVSSWVAMYIYIYMYVYTVKKYMHKYIYIHIVYINIIYIYIHTCMICAYIYIHAQRCTKIIQKKLFQELGNPPDHLTAY